MMKKILCFLCCIVVLFGFTACKNKSKGESESDFDPSTEIVLPEVQL